ncbi:hypothetical protein SAMN05421579_15221 [Xenorhabdus japonica]|uniref:Uncharacterized protein n=1 Tax=Xenorhabdus japonica TaxID=53341 RepID=A0A1I5E321_9GAMM|nr:hypothetical protein SAMN05421579_15221 [Xenorhabdus japonica]
MGVVITRLEAFVVNVIHDDMWITECAIYNSL